MTKIAAADETQNNIRDSTTPPARDPKIAVEEEYQMARRHGAGAGALHRPACGRPVGRKGARRPAAAVTVIYRSAAVGLSV
jgi:hypothetical protein